MSKTEAHEGVGAVIGRALGQANVARLEYMGESKPDEKELERIGRSLLAVLMPRMLDPERSKGEKIVADCLANDEPFFVFRGRDIFSPMVLKHYIKILEDYGPDDPDFQANIVQFINHLKKWQTENVKNVRYPD